MVARERVSQALTALYISPPISHYMTKSQLPRRDKTLAGCLTCYQNATGGLLAHSPLLSLSLSLSLSRATWRKSRIRDIKRGLDPFVSMKEVVVSLIILLFEPLYWQLMKKADLQMEVSLLLNIWLLQLSSFFPSFFLFFWGWEFTPHDRSFFSLSINPWIKLNCLFSLIHLRNSTTGFYTFKFHLYWIVSQCQGTHY